MTVQDQKRGLESLIPMRGLTSNSTWSWSFLQVAAKVSEVPNSKYHSLFFILPRETESRLSILSLKRSRQIAMLLGLGGPSLPHACVFSTC